MSSSADALGRNGVPSMRSPVLEEARRASVRLLGPVCRGAVGALAVVGLYQAVFWSGAVDERVLPSIVLVLGEIGRLATSPVFLAAIVQTVVPALAGLAIACAVAIPAGLLIGVSPLAKRATRGLIDLMRSLPGTALIPLFIFTIGVGTSMKVALVVYVTVWPILFNTMYGIASVDRVAIESARSCRVNGMALWWRVMLPSAAPFIATGIRYALPISVVIVIASEIVLGAPTGIGGYLLVAKANAVYQPALIYAILLAAGIVGFLLNIVADRLADHLVGWETRRGEPT